MTTLHCVNGALAEPAGRSRVERALVTIAHRLGSSPATWAVDVSSGDVVVPGATVSEVDGALAGAGSGSLFDFAEARR